MVEKFTELQRNKCKKNNYTKKTKSVILFVIILLSFQNVNGFGQKTMDSFLAFYNFDFTNADSIISELENSCSPPIQTSVAIAQYYWWQLITNQPNNKYYSLFFETIEDAESQIKTMNENEAPNDEDIFHSIYIYASRARLNLLNGNYVNVLKDLNKSIRYVEASHGREDEYKPFLLSSGLYNYFIDYGSRKYPPLRIYRLLMPEGNMELGINQLLQATRINNPIINTEAHYFLMKIFGELENDYEQALIHASWLTNRYPNNIIFLYHHYNLARALEFKKAASIKNSIKHQLTENTSLTQEQKKHFLSLLEI